MCAAQMYLNQMNDANTCRIYEYVKELVSKNKLDLVINADGTFSIMQEEDRIYYAQSINDIKGFMEGMEKGKELKDGV